ncbi:MAG: hypothetical protein GXO46_03525 [Chlorobi bacterium]|uniref:hypothetical protein n=1 Tax=Chryseobacterium sp. VD8 TaxID=3081254 RepID=UPI00245225B4|nr:hypothetical protein [Chlorobiota bacterium]
MKNPLIKMNGEFALQSMVNFFIMIISIMLNSLRSGVKDNYETRIRTTDPEAVAKIIEGKRSFLSLQSSGKRYSVLGRSVV